MHPVEAQLVQRLVEPLGRALGLPHGFAVDAAAGVTGGVERVERVARGEVPVAQLVAHMAADVAARTARGGVLGHGHLRFFGDPLFVMRTHHKTGTAVP